MTRADTVRVLMACAEAILTSTIDAGRYRDYFAWRLHHIPPVREVYEAFAEAAEAAARAVGSATFTALTPAQRRRCLASLRKDPGAKARERAVRRDILALFWWTDAFLHLGYESWPGARRGFHGLDRVPAAWFDSSRRPRRGGPAGSAAE